MKFILNEKFILDERFILTEANDDIKTLKEKVLTAINDNFGDALFGKLSNESVTIEKVNKVVAAGEEVKKVLETDKKDLAVYKGPVNAYTQAIEEEIEGTDGTGAGSVLNANPEIDNGLQKLNKLVETNTTDADEIDAAILSLKNEFNKLHTIILKSIEVDDSSKYADIVKQITEFKNLRDELIKGITNTTANDAWAKKEFTNFTNKISNEAVSLKSIDSKINTNDFIKQVSSKLKSVTPLFDKFNNFLANYSTAENPEEVNSRSTDWGERFKRVTNEKESAALWDEYFKTVWGNDAAKVRNLGQTFIQELLKAGFTEYTNPFITFVKNNINTLELNADTYPAIHNAYISEYIDDDDLKTKKTNNILYNENLYFKSAREIFEYLKIQSDASTQTPSDIAKETYGEWSANPNKLGLAIFDDKVSIKDVQKQLATKSANITGNLSSINLKSISEARTTLSLLGVSSSEITRKLPATDADVDRIYKGLHSNKANICQALLWLNTQYPESNLKMLVLDKITDLPTKNLDATNNKLLNEIKDLFKTLSFKNLPDFMLKLAKKAGFTIKE